MPILAENVARYPDNWPEISDRIRFERAGGRCECEGECGTGHEGQRCRAYHQQVGEWIRPGRFEHLWTPLDSKTGYTTIILTVAHLDHQPENCDDDNLKAMCQRCHLNYDKHHHYETRRKRKAVGDLFNGEEEPCNN